MSHAAGGAFPEAAWAMRAPRCRVSGGEEVAAGCSQTPSSQIAPFTYTWREVGGLTGRSRPHQLQRGQHGMNGLAFNCLCVCPPQANGSPSLQGASLPAACVVEGDILLSAGGYGMSGRPVTEQVSKQQTQC